MIANIQADLQGSSVATNEKFGDKRLLKSFAGQVEVARKLLKTQRSWMNPKEFEVQAESLTEKLQAFQDPPIGNIRVLLCLPRCSLLERVRSLGVGDNRGRCECDLGNLNTVYPPERLHALVGVNDGREQKLYQNGRGTHSFKITEVLTPNIPFNAWAALDLVLQYPNVLAQHNLLIGHTAIKGMATALLRLRGRPIFASTRGKVVESCAGMNYGMPSYVKLVTA